MRTLLVGPFGHGGEGVYMASLERDPPEGVRYIRTGGFHEGAPGARCRVITEVMLNRLVHPLAIPDMGFRALKLDDRFDLVHVHAHPVSLSGLGGRPLVMSEGSSAAVYLGDYLGWDERRVRRGFGRARRVYRALGIADRLLALDKASAVYVFSEWAKELNVRWGADPAKVEVIAPGFARQPEVAREDREEFTFLFVGGDFERKGGFELIEAFEALSDELAHVRLVLAGSDPEERNPDRLVHSWVPERRRDIALRSLDRLEQAGRATRISRVSREELLAKHYVDADAFVMPTHAEGFGFTNVEAMSFGLPVITSTAGPAREIVDDGRTGVLVPPGDIGALLEALRRLATDREATRDMGRSARARFEQHFAIDRFRLRLRDFYDRAVART